MRRVTVEAVERFRCFGTSAPSPSALAGHPRPAARRPVTPEMAVLAEAIAVAGALTGRLVDGILLAEIEAAGYTDSLAVDGGLRSHRSPSSSSPCRPPREDRTRALA